MFKHSYNYRVYIIIVLFYWNANEVSIFAGFCWKSQGWFIIVTSKRKLIRKRLYSFKGGWTWQVFDGSRKERGWQTARCHLALRPAWGAARAPAHGLPTVTYTVTSQGYSQPEAAARCTLTQASSTLTCSYTTVFRLFPDRLLYLDTVGKRQSSYSQPDVFRYILSSTCM